MTVKESNACRYVVSSSPNTCGKSMKRKSCNKKFCFDCLEKHFPMFWDKRNNKDWKCPCCSNECNCNQCRKNLLKEYSKERSNKSEGLTEKESCSYFEDKSKSLNSNFFLSLVKSLNVSTLLL